MYDLSLPPLTRTATRSSERNLANTATAAQGPHSRAQMTRFKPRPTGYYVV